jgi:hypothetical protein
MKPRQISLLLALLLVVRTSVHAQSTKQTPAEFAGVAWTATIEDAKKAMDQMPDSRKAKDSPDYLLYEGGTLAGQTIGYISFEFAASKLHRGAVVFRPATDRDKQFRELHDLLVSKYGPPTSSKRNDNLPQLVWRFPAILPGADTYTIICEMTKETRLGQTTKLIYTRDGASGPGATAVKSKGL